jgi:tRNA-specific 2-thiouridylase
MEQEFAANVVDYFVAEYSRGRTPNPCLPCNEHVKFRALVQRAKVMEARYLATGHYATVVESRGAYKLYRASDEAKDQSYVLYMLGQQDLASVRFPIGTFEKDQIRELAIEMGLPNASKPDSADICFLPTEDYRDFIAERVPQAAGDVVDSDGSVVGTHEGVARFTIGQRRGLGVDVGEKRYVTSIDPQLNVITIGPEDALLSGSLTAEALSWVGGVPPADEFEADVKIRYQAPAKAARIRLTDAGADVRFREPQRAITAGQAAVFYHGDEVLGGGIIARADDANAEAKDA